MKKIVHVVDYLMPDMGYQEFLLPKWNAKSGYDVYIITSDRYTPVDNYNETWGKTLGNRVCGTGESLYEGVKIIRLQTAFEIKSRPFIKGLTSAIQDLDPDLLFIHGTGSFSIYQCFFSFRNSMFKTFADNHMIIDIVQKGLVQKVYYILHKFFMKNFISSYIDIFFGVTKDSCDYLRIYEGIPENKVKLLSLGIDTEIFYPMQRQETEKTHSLIIQSGKLNDDKKPQWTAKAVLSLLEIGHKINLKFLGNGSATIINEIKEEFYKKGFKENLEITDLVPLNELSKEFNNADLVLFPEGTSLSAIEASACDTYVIMTDLPASREREEKGIGITYPRGDIEKLSNVLSSLLKDDVKLKKLAADSGKNARKLYSYESISKRMCEMAELN